MDNNRRQAEKGRSYSESKKESVGDDTMTYFVIITKTDGSQQPAIIQNVTSKEAAERMCNMYFEEEVEVQVFDEDEILFAIV